MTIPTRACAAIAVSSTCTDARDRDAAPIMSRRRSPRGAMFASGGRVAAQQGRGGDRSTADVVEVVAADVHVPELAPRPDLLAVQVHLRRRVEPRDVGQRVRRVRRACCRARSPSRSTRERGAVSPSGRSSTARRCCSNWLVTAPSMVQWPELCGRIASSLTSTRGGPPAASATSNSSTASTPGDAEPVGDPGGHVDAPPPASRGPGPGRGRPPRRTRRRAAPTRRRATCASRRSGRRATRTASSRVNGTFSSASSGAPVPSAAAANQSATSSASRTTRTPLPSYPPRDVLTTATPPWSARKVVEAPRPTGGPPTTGPGSRARSAGSA